jgi:PAS domain S-box-containing protein
MPNPVPGTADSNKQRKLPPQKPAEKALKESQQRSLLALEAAGVGTWSWNVTTDEIALDSRCKALFGLPEASPDITFQDLLLHLHPDDRKLTEDAILRTLDETRDYDVIHRVIWPDKSVHWLRCKGKFGERFPTQVFGLVIDVTWLKSSQEGHLQIEDQLRKSHDELERRVQERTAELERSTAEVIQQARLLDLANDAIFVRGADDRISYWNEGAERLYGWTKQEAVGQSPHDLLNTKFPIPTSEVLNSDRWEGELRHTKRDGTKIPVASRWTTLRDKGRKPLGWLEINTDISARKKAEEAASRLTSRILSLQDTERRRIARELHDCLGQYLTGLKINLDLLADPDHFRGSRSKEECLTECLEIVERCLTETRTLSYLMRPPLLDEAGLPSAVQWYVEGFVKRSGIEAHLNVPVELPRLRSNMELALFRVLQESLTNVHRHSASSAVKVTIEVDAEHVTLRVKDNGSGIPESRLKSLREINAEVGIGLAGMRERVRDLGGHLELDSDTTGTTVTAVMPLLLAGSESEKKDDISGHNVSAA